MSIVKINAITVPEGSGEELEKRFANRQHAVDHAPGFEGFHLLRPVAGEERYFVVTYWADQSSYEAWRDGDARTAHQAPQGEPKRRPVASGADLLEFDVVLSSTPATDDPSA